MLIPPLHHMSVVLTTKSHLLESTASDVLNKMIPGIGRDWSFIGSLDEQLVLWDADQPLGRKTRL